MKSWRETAYREKKQTYVRQIIAPFLFRNAYETGTLQKQNLSIGTDRPTQTM